MLKNIRIITAIISLIIAIAIGIIVLYPNSLIKQLCLLVTIPALAVLNFFINEIKLPKETIKKQDYLIEDYKNKTKHIINFIKLQGQETWDKWCLYKSSIGCFNCKKRTRIDMKSGFLRCLGSDSFVLECFQNDMKHWDSNGKKIKSCLKENKKKPDIQKFFDNCPTTAEIDSLRSEEEAKKNGGIPHFVITWSEKGRGFGEYTFFKENEQWKIDSESDGKNSIKKVLCSLVDSLPLVDEK